MTLKKIEHYGVPGMRKGVRKKIANEPVISKKIGTISGPGIQSTKVKTLTSKALKKPMKKIELKKTSDYRKLPIRTGFKTSEIPIQVKKKRSLKHSEESIEHYGVPGMKWGRRKVSQIKSGIAKERASTKRETQWKDQYQKRASMSNAALKRKVERLRLENEFRTLSDAAGAPSRKRAKKYIQLVARNIPIERVIPNPAAALAVGALRKTI